MATSSRATKPGTLRLSEVARKVSQPSGIVSTGWPDVERTCRRMGVEFDEWQRGAGRLILAKRADGSLASTVAGVGMSLPRQVGKTYLIAGLTFALCINNPGLLVIWTAHHLKTSGETFLAMQAFAERVKIAPHVKKVSTGSGDEEVRFKNGSRILFGARERGFGRGIPGVDMLVFDEAQILSDRALDAMLATMNTSNFGLHLYVGTPPGPQDASQSFTRMRTEALNGDLDDGVWIECGADRGARPDDRKQWAKANPSYPHRTSAHAIQRLQKKLTPEGFLREGLGVWSETGGAAAFGAGFWEMVPKVERPDGVVIGALGVAVSIDLEHAAVVAASQVDDRVLVKVLIHDRAPDAWLVDDVKALAEAHGCPVVIDGKGPAADFVTPLTTALGDTLNVVGMEQVKDACAGIYKTVRGGGLLHALPVEEGVDSDALDRAVQGATRRDLGDRWAWKRKTGDISPLEAATLAVWGISNYEPPATSAYESRGVLTI